MKVAGAVLKGLLADRINYSTYAWSANGMMQSRYMILLLLSFVMSALHMMLGDNHGVHLEEQEQLSSANKEPQIRFSSCLLQGLRLFWNFETITKLG